MHAPVESFACFDINKMSVNKMSVPVKYAYSKGGSLTFNSQMTH